MQPFRLDTHKLDWIDHTQISGGPRNAARPRISRKEFARMGKLSATLAFFSPNKSAGTLRQIGTVASLHSIQGTRSKNYVRQCDDHGVRGIVSTTRRVARRCAGRSQNTLGWCQLPRVPCGQKVDTQTSTSRNTSGKLTASAGKRLPGTATKVTAPSGTVRSVWQ